LKLKRDNSGHRYGWLACERCGKERWVALLKGGKPKHKLCLPCNLQKRDTCPYLEKYKINSSHQFQMGVRITEAEVKVLNQEIIDVCLNCPNEGGCVYDKYDN